MGLSVYDIFDVNSYDYSTITYNKHRSEFILGKSHIPHYTPTSSNSRVSSLLPIEGIDIPFTIQGGSMIFDDKWDGYMVLLEQDRTNINSELISSYMGKELKHSQQLENTIIDGGSITISANYDIVIEPGITNVNNSLYNFYGVTYSLSDEINILPKDSGFAVAIFLVAQLGKQQLNPILVKTDLIISQIGDYSTLYAVIESLYGVSYNTPGYIELYRGQYISQSPSTPYIQGHVNSISHKHYLDNTI